MACKGLLQRGDTHRRQLSFYYSETPSFHLLISEMTCLLHLPINGKLLDHGRIGREELVDMMVRFMGDDPGKASEEATSTRSACVWFIFFEKTLY